MKFAIIFALFALSICTSPVSNEELDLQTSGEIIDVLKCLLDKSAPLIPEVVQLIDAYKAKNLVKIIEILQKLVKEGKEVYLECLPQDLEKLGISVDKACLKNCGITALAKGVPACAPLVICLAPGVGLPACIPQAVSCALSVPSIAAACGRCIN